MMSIVKKKSFFKHRDTFLAIATAQNWKYRLYEEIGYGESIAKRNKNATAIDTSNFEVQRV